MPGVDRDHEIARIRGRMLDSHGRRGARAREVHDEPVAIAVVRRGQETLRPSGMREVEHDTQLTGRATTEPDSLYRTGTGRRAARALAKVGIGDVHHDSVRILEHGQLVARAPRQIQHDACAVGSRPKANVPHFRSPRGRE